MLRGSAWDLDDVGTRQAVAHLVVRAEPSACHVALPSNTSAEVHKFVCTVARHMHSKGKMRSFAMLHDLEKAGAVRTFLARSRKYDRPEEWVYASHKLANYSLTGFECNKKSLVEPLCEAGQRAEAALHARCLAAALPGVPRWG